MSFEPRSNSSISLISPARCRAASSSASRSPARQGGTVHQGSGTRRQDKSWRAPPGCVGAVPYASPPKCFVNNLLEGGRTMVDIAAPNLRSPSRVQSVQDHIDEVPMWADGTRLRSAPMTGMQWLIWSLAAAGKFFEGFVVFMTGVALPLLSREFNIGAAENGLITAATLFGILVGAVGLGGMSDRFGRKVMFVVEMVIFVAFLAALVFAPNFYLVVVCLFGIGLLFVRGEIEKAEQACTTALSGRGQACITRQAGGGGFSFQADLCVAFQLRQPARNNFRVGSMVLAGPRDLWHRHLHPDDPGRRRGRQ
jgi:hypothetical protein